MIRRNFLKTTSLLSLSPLVPCFVNQLSTKARPATDESILVVVELTGGNDGINTVIPFKDENYAKFRPKLKLAQNELLKVTDSTGLHPSLRACKEQFDAGEFIIINGVGYPNPTRSHFESLALWHTAGVRRDNNSGWLGHALDLNRKSGQTDMDGYFIGRDSVSAALTTRRAQIAALSRFKDLQLDKTVTPSDSLANQNEISAFVQRQLADSYTTAHHIESVSRNDNSSDGFPATRLGQQMRLISRLIKTDSAARVYYTTQGSYDTHSGQATTHSNLLSELSNSIKAFVNDLKKHQLDQRVVVLAFSEFGRTVRENGNVGTDHGTAGPVFMAGTPLQGGFIGETTSLSDLEDGDVKTQFDFRRIYATLLDEWLNIPAKQVLNQKYDHMDLL